MRLLNHRGLPRSSKRARDGRLLLCRGRGAKSRRQSRSGALHLDRARDSLGQAGSSVRGSTEYERTHRNAHTNTRERTLDNAFCQKQQKLLPTRSAAASTVINLI